MPQVPKSRQLSQANSRKIDGGIGVGRNIEVSPVKIEVRHQSAALSHEQAIRIDISRQVRDVRYRAG